jgi:hypothetical protein
LNDGLYYLLDDIVASAKEAGIDPRLLLANLIRESGDCHCWFSRSGGFLKFDKNPVVGSIGIGNISGDAFDEAKEYSNGAITRDWNDMSKDPAYAIKVAAFLLAKRVSQLPSNANPKYSTAQMARIGYRSGTEEMMKVANGADWTEGLGLFDAAFA